LLVALRYHLSDSLSDDNCGMSENLSDDICGAFDNWHAANTCKNETQNPPFKLVYDRTYGSVRFFPPNRTEQFGSVFGFFSPNTEHQKPNISYIVPLYNACSINYSRGVFQNTAASQLSTLFKSMYRIGPSRSIASHPYFIFCMPVLSWPLNTGVRCSVFVRFLVFGSVFKFTELFGVRCSVKNRCSVVHYHIPYTPWLLY